jgi:pyruvate ferredoxin oxidoreductase beta subunit
VKICKLAADSRFWPIYEVIDGRHALSYEPKSPAPIEDFLRMQGRYAHLFKKGAERMDVVAQAQRDVDSDWEKLLRKCE